MACEGYAFRRSSRILLGEQFNAVFAAQCGHGDATLSIQVKTNNFGHSRLGVSVSKKVTPSAVKRNYIKRQIREWFRHHHHTLGGIDLVVVARRQSRDASAATIHSALFNQWQRVKKKQCAGQF